MKNQRRFAPTKTGRLAPEQVAAFLRNQWPESAEYASHSRPGTFCPPELRFKFCALYVFSVN
jgi:hypothetical protein